jgi:hypothetical protein
MSSFTIPLNPEGDDSSYRLRPEYEGQVERPNMVDYGTSLHVQADLIEVVHGNMFEGKDLATLIIVDFRFTSTDPSRRFRYAEVIYKFRDSDPSDADPPRVHHIAPDGEFSMNRTEKTQELTRGANATAGSGFGPANVSLGLTWNLVETETKVDQARLTGFKKVFERNRPPPQTAWWSLNENPNDRNGIPNFMRAAILLKRKTNDRFCSTLTIRAKADLRYKFQDRSGKLDIAPVDYDPGLPRSTTTDFDPKNLGLVDLESIMAVQTMTTIATQNAIKLLAAPQKQKAADAMTEFTQQESNQSTTKDDNQHSISVALGVQPPMTKSKLDRSVAESAKTEHVHVPTTNVPVPPLRLPSPAESSIEETLRLLLHAVRTGVEVLAQAVRKFTNCWFVWLKDTRNAWSWPHGQTPYQRRMLQPQPCQLNQRTQHLRRGCFARTGYRATVFLISTPYEFNDIKIESV